MLAAPARSRLVELLAHTELRIYEALTRMHATGEYTIADLMEVFSVGRATVYRTLERTVSVRYRS